MTTLTVQEPTPSGVVVSTAAAAALGDEFANTGKEILEVTNGSGGALTVTVTAQKACSHGTLHNGGGSVAAGATKRFGPFPRDRFNDINGKVQVTYSGVTSLTVAVIKVNS